MDGSCAGRNHGACGLTVLLALALVLSLPASAPAYDVQRYDLRVEVDPPAPRLRIEATIEVESADGDTLFVFGLNAGYDSVSVSGPGALSFERDGDWIGVRVEPTPRKRTLSFRLSGDLGRSMDENRDIVADSSLFLLWSDRFYPISFDDWAEFRIDVQLPPSFAVLAPGREVAKDVFVAEQPIVCASVFADSRWVRETRTVKDLEMRTFLHPGSRAHADAIFETSAEVVDFFTELHGGYAFDGFSLATIEGIYARRAFPGFVGYSPAYLEKEMRETGHDAHETSLLWWGYTLRGSGPGSFQWTEGLGDYAEILYDEARGKPIPPIFRRFRDEYRAKPPEEDSRHDALRGNTPQAFVHGKYPWLMHLLRGAAGDEPFRRGVKLLFERYRNRTFSMDDLIDAFEEGTGDSLDWWRWDWLERRGVPEIEVETRFRMVGDSVVTSVRLVQPVPPRRFPLELEMGAERQRLWVSTAVVETRFVIAARAVTATIAAPDTVTIDPHGWIPARWTVTAAEVPARWGDPFEISAARR